MIKKTSNTLTLDLPITVNHQYQNIYKKMANGRMRAMKVTSAKAKKWVEENSPKVHEWIKKNGWYPLDEKVIVYVWFYYNDNRKRDCHNYFKLLFDQLEADGIVVNDKWIIPRVVDFNVDKKNPRIELIFRRFADEI